MPNFPRKQASLRILLWRELSSALAKGILLSLLPITVSLFATDLQTAHTQRLRHPIVAHNNGAKPFKPC